MTKLELYSKAEALQLIGRYHKLFVDRVQVEDPRVEVIEAIKRGELAYEAVVEAFKDESLAAELFRAAGVEV